MARFEDLEVWQRSVRLSGDIYRTLSGLKDFGFREQITKAGLSIPANIAEGYERGSNKELANFLNYAKGSAGELRTEIYVGMDIGYVSDETGTQWLREAVEISRMLIALFKTSDHERNKEQGIGGKVQETRYKEEETTLSLEPLSLEPLNLEP